jgi:hypothetical protein
MLKSEKNKITQSASDETTPKPNYREIIESSARLSAIQLQIEHNFLDDQRKW